GRNPPAHSPKKTVETSAPRPHDGRPRPTPERRTVMKRLFLVGALGVTLLPNGPAADTARAVPKSHTGHRSSQRCRPSPGAVRAGAHGRRLPEPSKRPASRPRTRGRAFPTRAPLTARSRAVGSATGTSRGLAPFLNHRHGRPLPSPASPPTGGSGSRRRPP